MVVRRRWRTTCPVPSRSGGCQTMSSDLTAGLQRPVASAASASTAWRAASIALGLIAATFVVFFWDAAGAAVQVWYANPTFNHCFLVIPVVAYLIWERRVELVAESP